MMYKKILSIYLFLLGCLLVQSQTNPTNTELDSIIHQKVVDKKTMDTLDYQIDKNTPITTYKFKTKFKKAYSDDIELRYDESENNSLGTKLKNLWYETKAWLIRNLIPSSEDLNSLSIFIKIGFWIIIAAFLYLIIRSIINRDITWIFTRKKMTIIPFYTIEEGDINSINFEEQIANTIEVKDYRLAIRYYYLWLLQTLSKQQYINWELEKTNADYLNEIKDIELKRNFRYLSYLYNNVWYGKFPLEMRAFNSARISFEQTLNKLNR